MISFSSWSIKHAIVEACSVCPNWGEELLVWALQLSTSLVSGDWWKENFVFAWPCTPFDFMCLSMFPLWVQFMQSTYLSKVSATDPYKSLALAYTQICCKHWVHVLHVTFTTLSSMSILALKSSLKLQRSSFLRNSFFLFFSLKDEDYYSYHINGIWKQTFWLK